MRFLDFIFGRNITPWDEAILRDIVNGKRRSTRQTDDILSPKRKRRFTETQLDQGRYERAVQRVESETSKAFGWALYMPLENPKKLRPEQLAKMHEIIESLTAEGIVQKSHAERMKRELEEKLRAE